MTALGEARAGVQRALALHAAHECDPEHPDRCDVLWRSGMCIHLGRCQTCSDAAPCATAELLEVVAELLEDARAVLDLLAERGLLDRAAITGGEQA